VVGHNLVLEAWVGRRLGVRRTAEEEELRIVVVVVRHTLVEELESRIVAEEGHHIVLGAAHRMPAAELGIDRVGELRIVAVAEGIGLEEALHIAVEGHRMVAAEVDMRLVAEGIVLAEEHHIAAVAEEGTVGKEVEEIVLVAGHHSRHKVVDRPSW